MGKVTYHQYTQDQRLAYLKAYDESGQSLRAFCENRELNHGTLHKWVNQRKSKSGLLEPEVGSTPRFVGLKLPKSVKETTQEQNSRKESDSIIIHRGNWSITIPRDVRNSDLIKVLRALEAVDAT